jgi:hypothetical protein
MIISKKAIPRRMVLRGVGASIALPLLDSMVPALSALARTPAKTVRRLSTVYVGNGAAPGYWFPKIEGRGFELTPSLTPLASHRDTLIVLSGIDNKLGDNRPGEPAGGHGRCAGSFLTGVHVKPTEGADFEAGISIDQIAGQQIGGETTHATLELAMESTDLSGRCDAGSSCAYVNTMCWRGPQTPLPMENNPRVVFERLFGDINGTSEAARRARMEGDRSILDSVQDKVARIYRDVGPRDRAKVAEFLESIRDLEKQIQHAESQGARELPAVVRPAGIPDAFDEHARMMFDLQVLAFQCDLTRVITFLLTPELSSRSYPELGVPDAHHALSHHQDNPEKVERIARINAFHAQLFAYYLERLRGTSDGDGSLLDHLTILYGAGMYDPNKHMPHNLPLLLAGGGTGTLKGGQHLALPGVPLTNLLLTLLGKVGVELDRLGDSTGRVRELSLA